jgi:hypothetical protein
MNRREFEQPSSLVFLVERDFMSGDPRESKRFDRFIQHVKEDGFTCFSVASNFRFAQHVLTREMFPGIPVFEGKTYGFWIGHVLRQHTYELICDMFLRFFNIELIHPPAMHRSLLVFDEKRYEVLAQEGLTAKSCVIDKVDQIGKGLDAVGGFPIFVKGGVQSLKAEGWKSCIFYDEEGLEEVVHRLLTHPLYKMTSEGQVVFRQYMDLELHGYSRTQFPMGMEVRYFYWRNTPLARGVYWRDMQKVSLTSFDEEIMSFEYAQEKEISELTRRVAEEFGGLYTVIDVARDREGNWKLIEIGDAQVAGFGRVNPTILWSNLRICLAGEGYGHTQKDQRVDSGTCDDVEKSKGVRRLS